jgi:hypothetical protein
MRRHLIAVSILTFAALAFAAGAGAQTQSQPACTITGTAKADNLRGTAGRDVICGLGGNDRITGRGGNDVVIGGPGRDNLLGDGGNDSLIGGPGADFLDGGPGINPCTGGANAAFDRTDTYVFENCEDVVPPQLTGLSFTPRTFNTSRDKATVAVALRMVDDLSGLGLGSTVPCEIQFESPKRLQFAGYGSCQPLTEGPWLADPRTCDPADPLCAKVEDFSTVTPGSKLYIGCYGDKPCSGIVTVHRLEEDRVLDATWEFSVEFPRFAKLGTWRLSLGDGEGWGMPHLYDNAQNRRVFWPRGVDRVVTRPIDGATVTPYPANVPQTVTNG